MFMLNLVFFLFSFTKFAQHKIKFRDPGPPARARPDPSGTDGVTSGHRKRWPRRWDP